MRATNNLDIVVVDYSFSSIPVHIFIVIFSYVWLIRTWITISSLHDIKRFEKNLKLIPFYIDSNDKLTIIFTCVKTINNLISEKERCITLRFLTQTISNWWQIHRPHIMRGKRVGQSAGKFWSKNVYFMLINSKGHFCFSIWEENKQYG